uniref:Uncharacterized protein n=1 Tax=Arion vulgaris TaxID=1028688 RepID=A0A0B7B995_9EUPU
MGTVDKERKRSMQAVAEKILKPLLKVNILKTKEGKILIRSLKLEKIDFETRKNNYCFESQICNRPCFMQILVIVDIGRIMAHPLEI